MKQIIAIVFAAFTLSAMAADAPKAAEAKKVEATAPAAPHKNEAKPVKSETKVEVKETKTK